MTGDIIPLRGDPHHDVLTLLPWYVTGRLDGAERASVEGHLRTCPACQAELAEERRLQAEMAEIPSDPVLPGDIDQDWAILRRRMAVRPRKPGMVARTQAWLTRFGAAAGRQWQGSAPWLRWTVAAQFALLLVVGVEVWGGPVLHPSPAQPAPAAAYHTLSAPPALLTANVIVMFRPDTREEDLRQTLKAANARLVDGPTAADAYMLRVPAAQRDAVITRLRRQPQITLAQPVDAGGTP